MTTEQMKVIERALVHIVSEEQKQDKTDLARKKNAHRHVCFVCLLLFKSRALLTRALRGALSTQNHLKAFNFNKKIYI